MSFYLIPFSLLVGTLLGGLAVHAWRGRSAEGPTRWQKLRLVVITSLITTLLLAATGYSWFRYRFRARPVSPATTEDALKDFRKTGKRAATEPGIPAAGVYTYKTKGFMKSKSSILGDSEQIMPPTIPAVLVSKDNCWELGLRMFKGQERTERYCRTPQGLRHLGRTESGELMGFETFTRFSTGSFPVTGPTGKPGSTWKDVWKTLEHSTESPIKVTPPDLNLDITYVGEESLDIGGKKVKAHHVRHIGTWQSVVSGRLVRDLWYAVDTGMMLKLLLKSKGQGLVTVLIDRSFVLASLIPQK